LDLPSTGIPDSLYYPCDPAEAENLLDLGISPGDRAHVHLSATIRSAAEAGRFHHSDPTIIEVDTARMTASGETVWHAGVTVYLTDKVASDFLTIVEPDNPELSLLRDSWTEEEE